MSYLEAFEKVRRATDGLKAGTVTEHLAIQVDLTDPDALGICYLEAKNGTFHAEPYDYRDRDARFFVRSADLVAILSGGMDYDAAISDGTLRVEGDAARARELTAAIPAPSAPKKPARKPRTPKAEAAGKAEKLARTGRKKKSEP